MNKTAETINSIPRRYLFQISSIHTGVGLSIVTISGFVNAEMKFLGWDSSTITLFFGIAILFELSRLIAGYLQDRKPRIRGYLAIGSVLSFFGLLIVPIKITTINHPIFIVGLALYYAGSAILTTIVDSYLTLISHPKERNRISGTLQFARLLGFAIGGILGSFTYSRLDFEIFIGMVNIILLATVIVTIISLDIKTWQMRMNVSSFQSSQSGNSNQNIHNHTNQSLNASLFDKNILFMCSFLILFSIGLFMQDLILEPFAIAELDFQKSDVGGLVAIWGIATLIFVPVGSTVEGRIGKMRTIIIGQTIATLGMIAITISSQFNNNFLFYVGLITFSMGGGISSSPAISIMLDLCYININHTSFLLGFFGIIITLGRSVAAITSGIVLKNTNDNYTLVFLVETIFISFSLIPIIPISRRVDQWMGAVDSENKSAAIIPSID